MTFTASNPRTVPLDPCLKVTGPSEKPAGDPVRDVAGGVVVRRELFERLNRAGRVTEVSGPAGSGKSVLLRSWIDAAGLAEQAAQVSVPDSDRDPRRFWTSVADALRDTAPGSALIRPLTALDGWAVVERLLADLSPLRDRIWLVIDDVHALGSAETRQLELLIGRAPAGLRFVLATRHQLRLGLHRLRLEGELTEIRAASLRFGRDEARALFEAAGVRLSESALALLHERTEGWAAGLRLPGLSLAGHPDPERFAAEFCGSERTVAEDLLAEVLERQSEEARRLLARTSVLERVSGPLADLLRSWFRYHPLLADLLELELRDTEPAELAALHGTAADWFAEHGFGADAVRHAQAARDWERASRLLADHWLGITLAGQAATVHQLVTAFPADAVTADAELTAVAAATALMRGSLAEADQLRLAGALDVAQPGLDEDLRALALISLGIAEPWSLRVREAEGHLERGVALARRIGRPQLEINGLAHWGLAASFRSSALAVERGLQAIELAQRHGWGGEPSVAIAYPMLAGSLIWQGKLQEAERWLMEGEYALRSEVEPATGMLFHLVRGLLEIAQGNPRAATAALAPVLDSPAPQVWLIAGFLLAASARDALGEREAAGRTLERGLDLAAPATPATPVARPPERLPEPISQAEARVLRFLPTSLSAPEIARELYVSVNTVRTHMRHLYDKLGAHRRLEAIDRARALGLLAPVPQRALY